MELKANELRIGNLVKRKYWNPTWINPSFEYQTCRIVALGKENAIVVDINGKSEFKIPYRDLQPIPLTEEWLLRFGFEKEHVTVNDIIINIYRLGDYEISIYLQGNETQKGYYLPHSLQSRAYIKYVHQLQNLYFSLTNNEIKLIK